MHIIIIIDEQLNGGCKTLSSTPKPKRNYTRKEQDMIGGRWHFPISPTNKKTHSFLEINCKMSFKTFPPITQQIYYV